MGAFFLHLMSTSIKSSAAGAVNFVRLNYCVKYSAH
jgi:hypothetical protein